MPAHTTFSQARPLVDDATYNAEATWSPDSKWVAFENITTTHDEASIQLFKINVYTGERVQLTTLPQGGPAPGDSTSWSTKGQIAFEMNGDIHVVDENGATVSKLID